ncbi:MAG: arginine repressor [Oscillospiraceae bacterium]|nr:arginine repressor [Oscillospiraceae bacterium]
MKSHRHRKILELIEANEAETQEELQSLLRENGFAVTQATVSRDIRELGLVKAQSSKGYKYAVNQNRDSAEMSIKFHAVFTEAVTSIDSAENIVVIRCYIGMANAACAALDSIKWKDVVGTIAGDDTIFCVMRDKAAALDFVGQLRKLI